MCNNINKRRSSVLTIKINKFLNCLKNKTVKYKKHTRKNMNKVILQLNKFYRIFSFIPNYYCRPMLMPPVIKNLHIQYVIVSLCFTKTNLQQNEGILG